MENEMINIIRDVMEKLENAYDQQNPAVLEQAIRQLEQAREQYGDRGTMLEDAITALNQAKNALAHVETAEDFSPKTPLDRPITLWNKH